MAKYMYLFGGGSEMAPEPWMAWSDGLKDHSDRGWPFGDGGKVVKGADGSDVSDFTLGAADATGFMIVTADTIEDAVAWTKGCPALTSGGWVQVRTIHDATPDMAAPAGDMPPTPAPEPSLDVEPEPTTEGSSADVAPAEAAAMPEPEPAEAGPAETPVEIPTEAPAMPPMPEPDPVAPSEPSEPEEPAAPAGSMPAAV